VRHDFPKISLRNLSCLRAASERDGTSPDGRMSAASNFLIRLRASRPWGMSVQTAELQHAISISAMRASGP
jgi:hypothetical protein